MSPEEWEAWILGEGELDPIESEYLDSVLLSGPTYEEEIFVADDES